uniref:(northern house mosquito) hypothetical protein n=1 Tax=Culex pipiens TaxID=7175 RepID=A0A8D8DGH0_CULPI
MMTLVASISLAGVLRGTGFCRVRRSQAVEAKSGLLHQLPTVGDAGRLERFAQEQQVLFGTLWAGLRCCDVALHLLLSWLGRLLSYLLLRPRSTQGALSCE